MHAPFQVHSSLPSFRLFSVEHVLPFGIILVLCTLLFIFRNKLKGIRKRRYLRFFLAFLLLLSTALEQIWLFYEHAWSLKESLPLQLSDLSVILAVVMLFTRSKKLFQFLYFAGLGSSIQAILTPDLGRYSFPHFEYFEFFVSHGGVVLACLIMVLIFNYFPTLQGMWITILIVNLYSVVVFFLNKWLGANYLYIMKKPKSSSLLDYLGQWPWYLLSMDMAMILSFYILYSPFWIKRNYFH
ncbi:TIGR02206 family membrane protein [Neobacillus drentensis]|uniref:YwaF family protein n=1 Tax=Neobacillus drentensis TaxID=220684 RepID=UPI001F42573E|nr:TIGR02206 family membrane protein [Neobacillus drentensis]ULT54927.1 TIGR02206 family membrane protein [Neobacillus drentensis]